jgi:hypothetical protein
MKWQDCLPECYVQSREHQSLIFLFTGSEELERKIGKYYRPKEGRLDFPQMMSNEDFSGGFGVLVHLAMAVFADSRESDVTELARLDERNLELAINTIRLRYQPNGKALLRGLQSKYLSVEDFEICDQSEATHVRITSPQSRCRDMNVTYGRIYECCYDPSEETHYIVSDDPTELLYDFDVLLGCEYMKKKKK